MRKPKLELDIESAVSDLSLKIKEKGLLFCGTALKKRVQEF